MTRAVPLAQHDPPGPIERFYQLLLQLTPANALVLLDEALQLLAETTSAKVTHLELIDQHGQTTFSRTHQVGRAAAIDLTNSRDRECVQSAIAEGRTIAVPAAAAKNHGGAILCVPIRSGFVRGFLWLQGKATSFSIVDADRAAWLANRIGDSRLDGYRGTLDEETWVLRERLVRDALRRSYGNVSTAARELGVSRPFIYAVLRRRPRRSI